MANIDDMDQFERAFDVHVSGPVAECECGKVYWDTYNDGYSWDEGEQDSLRANPKATGVPHGIGRISLEGREYCMDCTCWHAKAARITEWLRSHPTAIGEWFRLEKVRLQNAASAVPTIEGT